MSVERPGPLRIVVGAHQSLARAGLRGLLAARPEVLVVGQGSSADELASLAMEVGPHVVLAAWEPGEREVAVAAVEALAASRLPVVLVGDDPTEADLRLLLGAGAMGFLLSDASPDELLAALTAARSGLVVLDVRLVELLAAVSAPPPDSSGEEPLTERELEVLQLIATGLPNKTIATRLRISEHTVKFHVGSILAKLDAGSRTEAVTRAARRGLLVL